MKRQQGFTLIELVVVIVILGILAVTAAPKFMNLQGDARNASLQGLKGAIQGAAAIVYGKAAIQGVESSTEPVMIGAVKTIYGYPLISKDGIVAALASSDDWDYSSNVNVTGVPGAAATIEGQLFTFKQYADDAHNALQKIDLTVTGGTVSVTKGNNAIPKNCFLVYVPAVKNSIAQVFMPTNACKD
ncbi:type II secretion system protein [Photobacterium toruni]|uniref:Type II secretion system protein n=1 Tax=Photobacterium toruni TaxID=1935446 RepID=A0ABU6L7X3_9GAMM|nr:type II secretion system protein [Photobacterium toruni]